MKGRVSFGVEEGEDDDDDERSTPVVRRPASNDKNVRYARPTSKSVRGVRTSSTLHTTPELLLSQVRDRMGTLEEESVPTEAFVEEVDEDFELQKKASEARLLRARRSQEGLLENYISLEDTTQMYLDDKDISDMIRQSTSQGRRLRDTWEDPEDVERQSEKSSVTESEAEEKGTGAAFEDDLDMEAFDSYKRPSGRIEMKLNEGSDGERPNLVNIDFDDEETREWELLQIRKGFSTGTPVTREARRATRALAGDYYNPNSAPKTALPIMQLTAILSQVNKESSRISDEILTLGANLSQIELHRTECRKNIDAQGLVIEEAQRRRAIYGELQSFFVSFSEMVDELMPEVEELEQDWCALLRARKEAKLEGKIADLDDSLEYESLRTRTMDLFDDADPAYGDPSNVLEKLSEWKSSYPEAYEQCYGDLCIPPLLEIFVRARQIGWDPLSSGASVKEAFGSILQQFGDISNVEVRNKILTSYFVPRLVTLVGASYCALDPVQAMSLKTLLEELPSLLLPPNVRLLTTLSTLVMNSIMETPIKSSQDAAQLLQTTISLGNVIQDSSLLSSLRAKIDSVLPPDWPSTLQIPEVESIDQFVEHIFAEI
jgi:hypothetical protein